jgi:hypothetical protein
VGEAISSALSPTPSHAASRPRSGAVGRPGDQAGPGAVIGDHAIHKKGLHFTKGLRSTGGPDLLKWDLPGGGIKSAKVAPTPYCMSSK